MVILNSPDMGVGRNDMYKPLKLGKNLQRLQSLLFKSKHEHKHDPLNWTESRERLSGFGIVHLRQSKFRMQPICMQPISSLNVLNDAICAKASKM